MNEEEAVMTSERETWELNQFSFECDCSDLCSQNFHCIMPYDQLADDLTSRVRD